MDCNFTSGGRTGHIVTYYFLIVSVRLKRRVLNLNLKAVSERLLSTTVNEFQTASTEFDI